MFPRILSLATSVFFFGVCTSVGNAQCELSTHTVLPGDGSSGDQFGSSIDADGDVFVVGVPYDDPMGADSGSAYVYRNVNGQWIEEQKLIPSDGYGGGYIGERGDRFGHAVAVSGNVIAVGSVYDDDNGDASGSAYVFRFNGTHWIEEQKLIASDGAAVDSFGFSVAISDNTIVVCAPSHDENVIDSGAGYIFNHDGLEWVEMQKLTAIDPTDYARFGYSVDIDATSLIIGTPLDDELGQSAGASYIFVSDGFTWYHHQKIVAPDGASGGRFGSDVAISGDVAIVGSYTNNNENGSSAGAAYIYSRTGSTWQHEQKLIASNGNGYDRFGSSVDIWDEVVAVGAPNFDANSSMTNSGVAYVYSKGSLGWDNEMQMIDPNGYRNDYLGSAIAICSGALIIGTPSDSNSQNGTDSGAVFCVGPTSLFLTSNDTNGNGIADTCEAVQCSGDVNGNGTVNVDDLLLVMKSWGLCATCVADITGDGRVDISDLMLVLNNWGPCS